MEKKTKNGNSFSSQYTWPTARTVVSMFQSLCFLYLAYYRLCQDNVNDFFFYHSHSRILRHISNEKCLFNWTCWWRIMTEKVKALFLKHNTQSSSVDIICNQCFSSGGLNTLSKKNTSDKILSNINMLPLASGTMVVCFYLLVDLSRANCF